MLRSVLYVPADRPRMLLKAAQRHADLVLVDLEDAVAVSSKDMARQEARNAIPRLKQEGAYVGVRINSHPDHLSADLEALSGIEVDVVVVPKSDSSLIEQIGGAVEVMDADLIALIEGGRGLLDAPAMAAHPRVVRLLAGEADLGADLGMSAPAAHPAWLPSRMALVWASAAAGLEGPLGPVYTNLATRDMSELRATTRALAEIGFAGRSAIHPAHVPIINEVFTPSEAELDSARRQVEAYDEAVAAGRGVLVDEAGRMIDEAVVRRSRRIVADFGGDGG